MALVSETQELAWYATCLQDIENPYAIDNGQPQVQVAVVMNFDVAKVAMY